MIGFLPKIYNDELVYSWIARYNAWSGYPYLSSAIQDFYDNKTVEPSREFGVNFNKEAVAVVTKNVSIQNLILHHTMFPYYARFLPKERKKRAFELLTNMQGDYSRVLLLQKRKENRIKYLRYCPICAEHDRELYRETYWHRVHQITEIKICPFHSCYLSESEVTMTGKREKTLITAEEVVPNSVDIKHCDNQLEIELANYVMKVFQAKIDLEDDISVGDFLHSRMENSKYVSIRGEYIKGGQFLEDLKQYFEGIVDNGFMEIWEIQRIFYGTRWNIYEVCLMAMFLKISVDDLINRKLPQKTQAQILEEKIWKLHSDGLGYSTIAQQMGLSLSAVKAIGRKNYDGQVRKEMWEQMDQEMLPRVKEAIKKLHGDGMTRPRRVNQYAVEKYLNLPKYRISHLPRCKTEIERNKETQEEYWAREVVWAYTKVKKETGTLCWNSIKALIHVTKKDAMACIPHLNKFTNEAVASVICELL